MFKKWRLLSFGVVSKRNSHSKLKDDGCYLVAQSCSTLLWTFLDCSPPGSSVNGILQARILKWVAISLSRESSQPRDRTSVFCVGRWILYCWDTWEAPKDYELLSFLTTYIGRLSFLHILQRKPFSATDWIQKVWESVWINMHINK